MAYYGGGAVSVTEKCHIAFKENSMVMFTGNTAVTGDGASVFVAVNSTISFKEIIIVMFNDNYAIKEGAAIHFFLNSNMVTGGNSLVTFHNNEALKGAATNCDSNSNFTLHEMLLWHLITIRQL